MVDTLDGPHRLPTNRSARTDPTTRAIHSLQRKNRTAKQQPWQPRLRFAGTSKTEEHNNKQPAGTTAVSYCGALLDYVRATRPRRSRRLLNNRLLDNTVRRRRSAATADYHHQHHHHMKKKHHMKQNHHRKQNHQTKGQSIAGPPAPHTARRGIFVPRRKIKRKNKKNQQSEEQEEEKSPNRQDNAAKDLKQTASSVLYVFFFNRLRLEHQVHRRRALALPELATTTAYAAYAVVPSPTGLPPPPPPPIPAHHMIGWRKRIFHNRDSTYSEEVSGGNTHRIALPCIALHTKKRTALSAGYVCLAAHIKKTLHGSDTKPVPPPPPTPHLFLPLPPSLLPSPLSARDLEPRTRNNTESSNHYRQ